MVENTLIVKSNKLIEAKYKLNLNEQKVILYAVSKIDREKINFNILELDVREFVALIGTTVKRYSEIRELVRELRKKEVVIKTDKDNKQKELITGWLSSIEYKGNGKIELEFSKKLIPYLLQLKEQFTKYELKNILYLKNKYSIRVYEILKQYEKIGERQFELEELKKTLSCDNKYNEFKDFRRYVLNVSKQELCKYTDICFECEKLTKGRKVVGIKFIIKNNGRKNEDLSEIMDFEEIKMKSGLENESFNENQLLELYEIAVKKTESADVNPYLYIKLNYKNMIEKGSARNKFTWLKKALEEDYSKAIVQIGTGYIVG